MIDTKETFKIKSLSDSLTARLQARNLARDVGFNLRDQAEVSLATWTLAIILNLGVSRYGDITIQTIRKDNKTGIKIQCFADNKPVINIDALDCGEVNTMVDEIIFQKNNSNQSKIEIIAIKWGGNNHEGI